MNEYIPRRANKNWTCFYCGLSIPKGTAHYEHRTDQTPQFRAGTRVCVGCYERRVELVSDEEIIDELRQMIAEFSRAGAGGAAPGTTPRP